MHGSVRRSSTDLSNRLNPTGSDKIVILGNGPSLRELPFSELKIPSMGMNAAYRAWDRFDWAPTYYLCLDHELIHSHVEYIAASAHNQRFRGMFLAASILDDAPELAKIDNVHFVDQYSDYWWRINGDRFDLPRLSSPFYETSQAELLTTGSYAIRWAAQLGYRKIGLIGIDCRYEPLPEWLAGTTSDISLKMAATPASNPNYFFDDYQQQGDRFNVPNPASHGINLHLEAVRQADLDVRATEPAVEVYNLAQTSQLHIGGALPFRLPEEFCELPAIGSVLVPMIEREIPAALANLKTWDTEAFRPSRRTGADKPALIFCLNCEYVADIERALVAAYDETSFVKAAFSGVLVHFCDLPPEKDLYVRVPTAEIPPFGFKSGPNWLFYHAMTFAKDFGGYCLQIETDCRPIQPGWLDSLHDLATQSRNALILGSTYRGHGSLNPNFARHINGNALYHVGARRFWDWLDGVLWPWLQTVSGTTLPSLAYDCAWEAYVSRQEITAASTKEWRDIRRFGSAFSSVDQIINIAGAAEIRGDYVWTTDDLHASFPVCVLAHGPIMDSKSLKPSWIKSLDVSINGQCEQISSNRFILNDYLENGSFIYIVARMVRDEFSVDDDVIVSFDYVKSSAHRLQVQLVRHGITPYEADIKYLDKNVVSGSVALNHKVGTNVDAFRLQVGVTKHNTEADHSEVMISNVRFEVIRRGISHLCKSGLSLNECGMHTVTGDSSAVSGLERMAKVLLIDSTMIGGGNATGELKAKFFGALPDMSVMHVYWDYRLRKLGVGYVTHNAGLCVTIPTTLKKDSISDLISKFDPRAILYRPVEGNLEMSQFADRILDAFPGRSAIWVMDDLESDRNSSDPDGATTMAMLHDAVGKATVRWAISDPMAQELERRHGHRFETLRNGISAASDEERARGKVHPDRALVVRYSGGMAPDMNSESLLAVAKAVECLDGRVRLEIATQPHWYKQQSHRYDGFNHSSVSVADRTLEEYEAWIASADVLILAYNFDDVTQSYVRYSFANKYPELLYSGRPILSVGPSTIATVQHVVDDGFATVIAQESETEIANAIATMADSIHEWDGNAQRKFALERYGFDRELATFDEGLFDLYSQ